MGATTPSNWIQNIPHRLYLQSTFSSAPLTLPLQYLPVSCQPRLLRSVQDGVVCHHDAGLCGLPPGHQSGVVLDQSDSHPLRWLAGCWAQRHNITHSKRKLPGQFALHQISVDREKVTRSCNMMLPECLILTCRQGAVENHWTPSAGCLVHVETHNKLIASVRTQVLNHHALCSAVDEKSSKLQPPIIQRNN